MHEEVLKCIIIDLKVDLRTCYISTLPVRLKIRLLHYWEHQLILSNHNNSHDSFVVIYILLPFVSSVSPVASSNHYSIEYERHLYMLKDMLSSLSVRCPGRLGIGSSFAAIFVCLQFR